MGSLEDIDVHIVKAARAFIAKAESRYNLSGAILFGSRAQRNHRPDSDADIAVLLRGRHGEFIDTKLALADLAYEVLLDTGILVQPLPIWEDEWAQPERHTTPSLLRNISRTGVRL